MGTLQHWDGESAARNPILKSVMSFLSQSKKSPAVHALAMSGMAALALTCIILTAFSSSSSEFETQALAAKGAAKGAAKATPLKFGDTITLMDVYNEYVLCSLGGRLRTGGFKGGDDQIKIVSLKGGSKAVKYGDSIALMGQNGKYFMVRYSGVVTARTSVLAADTTFKVLGGSGPVMVGDRVSFKSEFGFVTGTPSGLRSTVPYVTATEKFSIGLPGMETGLRLADGIQYGDVVMMINKENEYLQADHNGWIYYRAKADGNWDHFTVLSPIHREGKVSFGDQIVMRAHNGRMVSSRTGGNLEAVSMVPTDNSVFTILGIEGASTGIIHDRDVIVLRNFEGFVDAAGDGARVSMGPTGHLANMAVMTIQRVWDSAL